MPVTVHVPTSLRDFSDGKSHLALELADPATLQDVFDHLRGSHPGVSERVLDEQGAVRQHVNIFVEGNNVRLGRGLETKVGANSEVWILPAVSGG